ncbi:methyltransferase, putative [Entamoeba invadens IP1]|uniref:tRNA (guanine(9)-N(1))-methyltransferase n=1 Tax=Entamoeba invadens IP1 TaxID=370355 RepID=A0A0A1TUZ8_ENTIV|nr:methyltransferase, putative [Entamoeba invadens IP1]ELP84093.1 methyltransferase, putative [Entamoeba invadens IP1]|eukprot:XP_004183439.1 methyltransferase, putative [Entamoeba invadens IP1]
MSEEKWKEIETHQTVATEVDDKGTKSEPVEKSEEKMSKRQQRKLEKKEYKDKMWKETRCEVRKKRKERAKEERKKRKENGEELPKRTKIDENTVFGGNLIIDCDFGDKMNEREEKSFFNQIQMLYGQNRKYTKPLRIRCLGVDGRIKESVTKVNGQNWKGVTFEDEKIDTVKDIVNCIYLTAESKNVLESIDEDTYYVIGGIVDHNKFKGLCNEKAEKLGIKTARLPISENVVCLGRKVLTVNQVFEILGEFCQCKNWKTALEKVMPQRKQETKKQSEDKENKDDDLSI